MTNWKRLRNAIGTYRRANWYVCAAIGLCVLAFIVPAPLMRVTQFASITLSLAAAWHYIRAYKNWIRYENWKRRHG